MKQLHTILTLCALLLLASCNDLSTQEILQGGHNEHSLEVTDAKMYDNYRKFVLQVESTIDLGDIDIADTSQVDIVISDYYSHLVPVIRGLQPTLDSVRYIAPDMVHKAGLNTLILVDLSQPSPVMTKQLEYVRKMHTLFCRDNLYLAFMMPDGSVSSVVKATDYVINNYIATNSPLITQASPIDSIPTAHIYTDSISDMPQKRHALLYRSVSQMLYTMSGHTGTVFDDAHKKALIILSDGQVYDEVTNTPLDPQHFIIQERLINQSHNMPTNTSVFYVNLPGTNVSNTVKDNNMMRMLCMQSGGKFITDFNWHTFHNDVLHTFNIPHDDYGIYATVVEGKVFLGSQRYITIKFYRKGTKELVAECREEYCLGNINAPIIVGNPSFAPIYISGLLIALLLAVIIYIILQFIVPYVRYRIFRRKYVVQYTGKNMSVGGNLVADTCYFCKAPFQVGDIVVAKCQHTMHEECWMENDQHCPEYSHRCPNGSHFYDPYNIMNPRSGSYTIKWIIPSIFVSALVWLIMSNANHTLLLLITDNVCKILTNSVPSEVDSTGYIDGFSASMAVSPRMYLLPLFGMYLAPLLTILFASLAGYRRPWRYRINDILLRAFIVMVSSILIFFTEYIIVYLGDIYDGSPLFDWIPWTIVTYIILFASTKRTRINDLYSRTMLGVSFLMGIVNAFLWDAFGTFETKHQIVYLIFLFILYGMVLAITISRNLPPSEKYFLHIKGEVKEMDIALYKWLRQSPDSFVTIGRSVDCQLHISWDATSDIAPVHAIIRVHSGIPYITSADGDVLIDSKLLAEGKKARLHHGMSFQIGTTTFTYMEA